jgi:anti-sigma regulatory factor (Ser/Thr protein kinase)
MSTFHFQPIKGKAHEILKAILQTPEIAACSLKDVMLLRLACEEVVMNITSYAYPEGSDGYLDIEIQKTDRIIICFIDGGRPFNPLEQPAPDTELSWKRRRIGGLGIFLVTRKMDNTSYVYQENKNVLTIEKVIKNIRDKD